jgi:hypothetical protein
MWLLIPLAGAAAGYYLGRENPAVAWTVIIVCMVTVVIGLGDPAVAVQVLGCIIAVIIGLVILYNIIPIILWLFGFFLAIAFALVVLMGLLKLIGG